MKKCPNVSCQHENPDVAKYCGKCGFPLLNDDKRLFTMTQFSAVPLMPVSLCTIKFVGKFKVFLWFVVLSVFMCLRLEETMWYVADALDLTADDLKIYEMCAFVLLFLLSYSLLKAIWKRFRFRCNVKFVEADYPTNDIVRIARNSKMGLFRVKKKKVLLRSVYTYVDVFDKEHLIVVKGEKKGLYSLTYLKMIVPVRFERIAAFDRGVTAVRLKGNEYYYDVKGNRVR